MFYNSYLHPTSAAAYAHADDFSTMTTFAKLAIESLHAAHPECKVSYVCPVCSQHCPGITKKCCSLSGGIKSCHGLGPMRGCLAMSLPWL